MTLLFLGLLIFLLCGVPGLARIIVSESLRPAAPPTASRTRAGCAVSSSSRHTRPGAAFSDLPSSERNPVRGRGQAGTLRRQP